MKTRTILFQLFGFTLALLIVTIGILAAVFIRTTRNFYFSERKSDLINTTRIVKNIMDSQGFPQTDEQLHVYSDMAVSGTEARLTVVEPGGVVLSDSEGDVLLMSNHAGRPEIKAAIQGDVGYSLRYSATISRIMMYVAMPVYNNGELAGVVRISYPSDAIEAKIWQVVRSILLVSLIVFFLAALISWYTARNFSRLINEIRVAAAHFSREDFSVVLELDRPEELKQLGSALNAMAQQLALRIETIRAQKNELQEILDNMSEPVILTDHIMNIKKINAAARSTFVLQDELLEGRNMLSIFRNTQLHDFGESVFKAKVPGELDLVLESGRASVIMQIYATPLLDPDEPDDESDGLLFVMHDITQAKKLEMMRKDFVSSVSHELKTPITNIKGYVETLRGNPDMDRERSVDFLDIIARHTDRLTSIIDDLLILSEIEKRDHQALIVENCSVRDLLTSVIQVCSPAAAKKEIELSLDCPAELEFKVHPLLAEQAVLNLVDNAVKYSPKKTKVEVKASETDKNRIQIDVADQGRGIEQEHLDRIFERFYRVDKARSRDAGGTGLGLSIVKHIALAHGGQVRAESEIGKGSIFTISF